MIRASHGVHAGCYYYEVEVLQPEGKDGHVRIGWSTRQGELQSFVGYDKWSYGYRDVGGRLFLFVIIYVVAVGYLNRSYTILDGDRDTACRFDITSRQTL